MSDQYVTPHNNQYDHDVEPATTQPPVFTVQTSNTSAITQEVLIAGHKLILPRLDVIQQLQIQVNQLTQELQNLKFKHVRLQQQHVNLAQQVISLQRTSGSVNSYE